VAKVPKGKTVWIGARKYRAGEEIPDGILALAEGASGAGRRPAAPGGPGRPLAAAGGARVAPAGETDTDGAAGAGRRQAPTTAGGKGKKARFPAGDSGPDKP